MHRVTCLRIVAVFIALSPGFLAISSGAPPDRVVRRVDAARTRPIAGSVHRSVQPQYDRGSVDPSTAMNHIVLMTQPSAAQQAELDKLLADQQNPSSPLYHRWLSPEEFGGRFGLSPSDYSKLVAWLNDAGLTIDETARGRNWVAFSGAAGQVSKALHTRIHRLLVDGETHFANVLDPSVPDALADVVGGFLGLDDFYLRPLVRRVDPRYNTTTAHYLAPEDFATIYDIAPLYQAGIDGTGQSIAVVGQSAVSLSDLRAFRSRYNLPANDPKMLLYGGTDPGFAESELEGDLDLEWAGAIAPKATLYYVYGASALAAMVYAVNQNVAPIISVSYGNCEVDYRPTYYRAIGQQANAQGITILAASGDSGAAGCDRQDSEPLATRGRMVDFPAAVPEVTGVGGTQFVEGTGSYWASTNSANSGSALSYIPEQAWNESGASGLGSSGGGASLYFSRPAWQSAAGLPLDAVRHVPDVSLTAASHDAYIITSQGSRGAVAGTSASAPSMAGIVALLNQYQVAHGFQQGPGLGNVNPQLYRLAQTAPSVFHDVVAGDNVVPCAQGSPDCLTGSFGYPAGAGYDMATGLGSVDANALVTQWNTKSQDATVTLLASASRPTLNDTVNLTALVNAATGGGVPTGTVSFSANGVPLGSAALISRGDQGQAADLTFPAYLLSSGTSTLVAEYSGDTTFGSGGAEQKVQVTTPKGTSAAIVPTWPNSVWPSNPDAQGLSWQTPLSLREAAGVPALLTGFTIDRVAQPLSQYFPSPNIPANGTVSTSVVFRNLAPPVARTFGFTGVDAGGGTWSREVTVNYYPLPLGPEFVLTSTPLVVAQDTSADQACQWPVQLSIDEIGGFRSTLTQLVSGGIDVSSQIPSIFGTTRLDAWGSLQGLLCFGGIAPPATNLITVYTSTGVAHESTVSFAGPPKAPGKISATPSNITLAAADANHPAQTALAIGIADPAQQWTASIFPANRTSGWLSASALSGSGPGQIVLTASGSGFEPGAYKAAIVVQSSGAMPQVISVPVMFVLGGSTSGMAITGAANAASYQAAASPGMTMSIFGTKLGGAAQSVPANPAPYSAAGVSATVNSVAAPILFVSPSQLNIQVPYEVGAGPAVLGVSNNGEVAGFQFQLAPAAPGIYTDASGSAFAGASVAPGAIAKLMFTGAGEIAPTLDTALSPTTAASAASYKAALPLSITVGGVPALVQSANLALGLPGTMQVTFIVPASVAPGPQPVVVTVGGVSSPPVVLKVAAPALPTARSN